MRDAEQGCCSLCLLVSSSTWPLNKVSLNVNALFSSYFLPKMIIDTLVFYHVLHCILTLVYSLFRVHHQQLSYLVMLFILMLCALNGRGGGLMEFIYKRSSWPHVPGELLHQLGGVLI